MEPSMMFYEHPDLVVQSVSHTVPFLLKGEAGAVRPGLRACAKARMA